MDLTMYNIIIYVVNDSAIFQRPINIYIGLLDLLVLLLYILFVFMILFIINFTHNFFL